MSLNIWMRGGERMGKRAFWRGWGMGLRRVRRWRGKRQGNLDNVEDKVRGGVLKLGELSFGMKANGVNGVKGSS
jgi:hypothetical protein